VFVSQGGAITLRVGKGIGAGFTHEGIKRYWNWVNSESDTRDLLRLH